MSLAGPAAPQRPLRPHPQARQPSRPTWEGPVALLRDLRRAAVAVVNPVGWALLGTAVVAGVVAAWAGWLELGVLACACALVLLLAVPFLIGRTRVAVDLDLDPSRVVAGDTVTGSLAVTNRATRRMIGTNLDLPVGAAVRRYALPPLAPEATHREDFLVRTQHRGVIEVGPATTRRGDPLGIFSRDVAWTDVHEILVRPPMVPLDSLGAGLLRDLEGVETDAISASDLAFHALREYVPGDDLRHVHWRSSAKVMASAGENQLLVRQYLDTRRSHATVVVDDNVASWPDEEAFEVAMSVAASILRRAAVDEFETSFVCGREAVSGAGVHGGTRSLDSVCRAGLGRSGLVEAARSAARVASGTSLLFLVGTPETGFETFLRASAVFGQEVRRCALVVDPAARTAVTETSGLPVLRLADRRDLGPVLQWSVR